MTMFYNGTALLMNVPQPMLFMGRFQPNGSGTIDNTKNKGPNGWTVARTTTGVYTVTFKDNYKDCVQAQADISSAAVQNVQMQIGTITPAPSPKGATIVINAYTGGGTSATDIANDANTWIHFLVAWVGTVQK